MLGGGEGGELGAARNGAPQQSHLAELGVRAPCPRRPPRRQDLATVATAAAAVAATATAAVATAFSVWQQQQQRRTPPYVSEEAGGDCADRIVDGSRLGVDRGGARLWGQGTQQPVA